jgi:hypothetical protein
VVVSSGPAAVMPQPMVVNGMSTPKM